MSSEKRHYSHRVKDFCINFPFFCKIPSVAVKVKGQYLDKIPFLVYL